MRSLKAVIVAAALAAGCGTQNSTPDYDAGQHYQDDGAPEPFDPVPCVPGSLSFTARRPVPDAEPIFYDLGSVTVDDEGTMATEDGTPVIYRNSASLDDFHITPGSYVLFGRQFGETVETGINRIFRYSVRDDKPVLTDVTTGRELDTILGGAGLYGRSVDFHDSAHPDFWLVYPQEQAEDGGVLPDNVREGWVFLFWGEYDPETGNLSATLNSSGNFDGQEILIYRGDHTTSVDDIVQCTE